VPARTPVRDLTPGMNVDCIFNVREVALSTAKNGNQYIRALLADKSGAIKANKWDADEGVLACFSQGGYVRVRGTVESFRGQNQIKIEQVRSADQAEVDPTDFLATTDRDLGGLRKELKRLVKSVKNSHLSALLQRIFEEDHDLFEAYCRAPAANKYHHAYIGGLLEHSVAIAKGGEAIAEANDRLDRDLLVTGALLHDIGKIEELSSDVGFDKTDEGQMVGHICLGAIMLHDIMSGMGQFPQDLRLQLLHLVLSHHGMREYGSPIVPATAEALALHHLDNLDAKVQAADAAAHQPAPEGAKWTEFVRMLETRVYRGHLIGDGEQP
jgi:3'-5' exoribonuclease